MFNRLDYSLLRLGYLLGTLLCCALVIPVLDSVDSPQSAILYGGPLLTIVHGAITLLTVEFVWGEQAFWRRLASFVGWWWAGASAWLAGLVVTNTLSGRMTSENGAVFFFQWLLMWPWTVLSSQLALWILRYALRLRLVHLKSETTVRGPDQWSIRDFGVGTALIAIAMAGARSAVGDFEHAPTISELTWFAAGVMGLSSAVTVPAALYTLRPRRMGMVCLGLGIHFLVAIAISGFLAMASGVGPRRDVAELIAMLLFGACYVGPVAGCFVLRFSGYRLLWLKETQRPEVAGSSPFSASGAGSIGKLLQ